MISSGVDHAQVLRDLSTLAIDLAPNDAPDPIVVRRLSAAGGFSARRIVYVADFTVERPLIVSVLEGEKQITHTGISLVAGPGDVIVLPARVPFEMSSTPCANSKRFRSFIVELHPEVSTALSARHPKVCPWPDLGAFDPHHPHVLRASTPALQAVLHFARSLLVQGTHDALIRHRLEDLLLSLSLQKAHEQNPRHSQPGPADDLVLAVRQLVREAPETDLSADMVARKLAVSPATLRRRLAEAGVSLRTLRAEERMALARTLLSQPGAQVADVALRCGYRSPSKFARQFRRLVGAPPRRRAG